VRLNAVLPEETIVNCRSLLLGACLLSTGAALADNSAHDTVTEANKWTYGVSVQFVALDGAAVADEGLGDGGFALGIEATRTFDPNFSATLGLSFDNYDDNLEFEQDVVDNFGTSTTLSSSATAMVGYAEANYRRSFSIDSPFEYRLGAGYSTVFSGSRDIANCTNCFESSFELEGGPYVALSLGKNLNAQSSLGITARSYVSGDYKQGFLLWWQSR